MLSSRFVACPSPSAWPSSWSVTQPRYSGSYGLSVETRRQVGTDEDVRALVGAAERVAAEHDAACGRHVVHDDVGRLALAAGHVGERDQAVEAVAQHRVPCLDRIGDRGQLRRSRRWVGLHGDREVGVVPPVARIRSCSRISRPSASDSGSEQLLVDVGLPPPRPARLSHRGREDQSGSSTAAPLWSVVAFAWSPSSWMPAAHRTVAARVSPGQRRPDW